MKNAIPSRFLLITVLLISICCQNTFAADFYWVNGNGAWNDGGHWSTTSGGSASGSIPGESDNAFFDENSFDSDLSLVNIPTHTLIHDLTINTIKYCSFYGGDVNLTIGGDLEIKSKVAFQLSGAIKFNNTSSGLNKITTNDIDIYTDIAFEAGSWELNGHLKTGQNNTIYFNKGALNSNGYTLHSKNIIANEFEFEFDLTDSYISVMNEFNVSKGINVGGAATYAVLTDDFDIDKFDEFGTDSDLTKDITVLCDGGPLEFEVLITSDYNGADISCFDSCDGEFTVSASGTPGPFAYRLSPSDPWVSSGVFSGLCNDTYTLAVMDSSNELGPGIFEICSAIDNLVAPGEISFDEPVTINPTCFDLCDGQAFIAAIAGGTGTLDIFWSVSGETTAFPEMLCVGANPISITDENGCELTDTVFITEPITISANPTITAPICAGDCNAIIELAPSGGNGAPFTFAWTPEPGSGAGTNPAEGFCAGTVNVSIFDADGCSFDTTLTIIDPPVLTVTVSDIEDANCNGDCDGEATANPVGGIPGYTYEWFDNGSGLTTGITDQTATGLCAGEYVVVVTDASGCEQTSAIVTIGEPDPFILNVDGYPVSCFGVCDGAADVDVTGGVAPYTFSWTIIPSGIGIGATDSISGLCPGEYQIIITDSEGCSSLPISVTVSEPAEVTATITGNDPTCFDLCDGDATVVPGGGTPGYTFTWSPAPPTGDGTDTGSDMCAGDYTVTVTDANGCDVDATVTLTSPEEYDITTVITDPLCFGDTDGSIDVTVNSGGSGAGYTFTWAPTPPTGDGTANVSGLGEGTWTVTIADSEGCDTTLSFEITTPPAIVPTASVISSVFCNGDCTGSASVTISGGTAPYTVLWDDPLAQTSLVATNLCAGDYTVTVTDFNGCEETATVTITESDPFDMTLSQTNPSCFGDCDGTATVLVNSGGTAPYTILWDDPLAQTTFTAVDLCAGTYTAVILDNNLCDTTITITIVEPDELIATIAVIDSTCFGLCTGSAFVIASGGTAPYSFEWFNAATDISLGTDNDTITDLCGGDYYVIITDANGCTVQSIDVNIFELPEIESSIVSTTDATCALCDGTAEITATGGSGGFTFDWDPDPATGDGTASVTGLCSGGYTVTITDDNGCTSSIVVSIDDIALETLELDSVDVSCFGLCDGEASATFDILDPPYTLEWFDNITGLSTGIFGTPATGLCAGEYLAVLTNSTGCVTTEIITVNEPEEITGTITATNASCFGLCDGTASIVASGGTPPYTYDWGVPLPGSGEGTPNVLGLCAGPWEVEVTDAAGCIVVFTTTVTEPDEIIIDAESSTGISCFGDTDGTASVIVSGGTPPLSYEWFDCTTGLPIGQTGPLATDLAAGSYECVITDDNGCTITSTCIPVDDAPEITAILNTENVTCFGLCDGLISVVPGGGVAPYFFQWLDEFGDPIVGQTNDSLENLCIGTYNLEITDLNGCIQLFGPIDMTSPSSPWDVVASQTDIGCAGDCDGTATVLVLDGNTPPYTYVWDDPLMQVTPTASFLCEGTWTVTISDAGVCDTTITFEIIDSDPIFANLTDISDVLCFGDCSGEVTVDPIGGTGPYVLNWSDGQTGTTASGLCAGDITLTITDATGCSIDTTFSLLELEELTLTSSFSNNTSCGECNGSATVNVSGGLIPYSYDWDPDPLAGEGTNNATGLCPGVVNVLITDDNGCTLTEVFSITDVSGEDLTATATDASCFGVCDGTAEAIYICSEEPCTQEWFDAITGLSTGVTTPTITGLCAGEYSVELTNGEGCIAIATVTINEPAEILPNEVITPIVCADGTDGTITLSPTGGSGGGYTYAWSPVPPNGDGTNEALDLGPGIWEVTVTDGDGCSQTFSYDLINPEPIVLTTDATDASCNGLCNGAITLTATGGGGSFTYQWFMDGVAMPGETADVLTGLCAGDYNVEVTDANGCTVTLPIDVTISEPIAISGDITTTNVTCFGFCDGTATIAPEGGSPAYIINWYNAITGSLIGITGETATGLCPGSYFAIITDDNGCDFTSATVEITEPDELTFTLTTTNTSCFDFCDGSGEVIVSGGTPTYIYEWLTIGGDPIIGGTTPSVTDLCEGNYTVEIVDDNGCTTGVNPLVINAFEEIVADVFTDDATCNIDNGNASVFASGGNAPYTYQWFDVAMTPLAGETANTLLGVGAGIYFVTVTDINGCEATFTAIISDFNGPVITYDEVNNPTCFDECNGNIAVTITGDNPPFLFSWDPDGIIAEDPTGLCAGDYILEVIDDLGCISYADTTLINPTEITAPAVITSTSCGLCDGAITISPTGGTGALTVLWNTGSTALTLTDLCSGVYEVEITDESGCSKIETYVIENSEGLTAEPVITAINCANSCDGEITINASGGVAPYTYFWLHDGSVTNTLTGLCADTYYIEITDATGCITTFEVTLEDPDPITATATVTNPACGGADGALNIMTSGGILPHTFSWDTGESTAAITGLDAGIYVLTVTDANGCTEEFTYTLNNVTAPAIELTTTDIDCYGNCNGTIDTLNIIGGNPAFTFNWLDAGGAPLGISTPLITDLCAGLYILQVTDDAGCISFQGAEITEPDTIIGNPLFSNNPSCFGDCDGLIVANPFGGTLPFDFSWNDPDNQTTPTAVDLCAGTYIVTMTDANGCSINQTATLIEPAELIVTIDSVNDATCQDATDGEIFITVTGGNPAYDVIWVSEDGLDTLYTQDIDGLLPMDYYLTITDANGCQQFDTVSVDTAIIVIANAGPDTLLCLNGSLLIYGNSNILDTPNYAWYDTLGNVLSDSAGLLIESTVSGEMYYIFETEYMGCTDYDTVIVTTANEVFVDAGPDIELFSDQSGSIGGSPTTDPSNSVEWTPITYLNDPSVTNPDVIEPELSTWYYVTATDTNGCTNLDSVFVQVIPNIIIPDGITPGNGDGKNDTWILDFIVQYPDVSIKIQIYNRWGDLLFEDDENYNNDWDGTTEDGKRLPAGTYYYVIDVDHPDFPVPFTGPLTIMW